MVRLISKTTVVAVEEIEKSHVINRHENKIITQMSR